MNMNCERVVELLTQSAEDGTVEERRLAAEHAAACADCRDAVTAVQALRAECLAPVPRPRAGAFESSIAVAVGAAAPAREARTTRPFWSGVGVGAALAAGLAIALVTLTPLVGSRNASAPPQLTLAASEERNVSISVASPEALESAEIHVVLSGPIELRGFEGQRELRWRTDLDRGANQLTLPVVAKGMGAGQLLVEVTHGEKRRTFVVDIESLG